MSFSNNSTSINRKKFSAEQELQESLSSSECETRPLKHSSAEEQRSDRSEEFNNPQIMNSSHNLEIQKEIVNYIRNTMIIDLLVQIIPSKSTVYVTSLICLVIEYNILTLYYKLLHNALIYTF
ncbi:hypothetical protein NEIG_00243 [Nematocida sp. ERTm5]|nr:hypothetical protein NEIG_00243 [Nematocida sp. ERTm5]